MNPTEHNQHPDQITQLQPAIWVASLADYTNGHLHGQWIHANQQPSALYAAVHDMLANSPTPGAEEWAIFDYDDFAGLHIDEHDRLEDIAAIATGLRTHGPAFGAWAKRVRIESKPEALDHQRLEAFEDYFLGEFDTPDEWAHDLLGEAISGVEEHIPQSLQSYIHFDYNAFARDCDLNGDITVEEAPNGRVWIFRT